MTTKLHVPKTIYILYSITFCLSNLIYYQVSRVTSYNIINWRHFQCSLWHTVFLGGPWSLWSPLYCTPGPPRVRRDPPIYWTLRGDVLLSCVSSSPSDLGVGNWQTWCWCRHICWRISMVMCLQVLCRFVRNKALENRGQNVVKSETRHWKI